MQRARWLLRLAVPTLCLLRFAAGQTVVDAKSLEAALKARPLGLRTYSADTVSTYAWDGKDVVAGPVSTHTLGVFTTQGVKVKGGKVVLDGQRATVLQSDKAPMTHYLGRAPMRLEIDLRGADASAVLPLLQDALFFRNDAELIGGLPAWVGGTLPLNIDGKGGERCRCHWILDNEAWFSVQKSDGTLEMPRMVPQEPRDTIEVPGGSLEAAMSMLLSVSLDGTVGEVWISKPSFPEVDAWAVSNARRYRFRPARWNGKAVGAAVATGMTSSGRQPQPVLGVPSKE